MGYFDCLADNFDWTNNRILQLLRCQKLFPRDAGGIFLNEFDALQNMPQKNLWVSVHKRMTCSLNTRSRIAGCNARYVSTSTFLPVLFSKSNLRATRSSKLLLPRNSTRTSRSLCLVCSPRANDPNKAARLILCCLKTGRTRWRMTAISRRIFFCGDLMLAE